MTSIAHTKHNINTLVLLQVLRGQDGQEKQDFKLCVLNVCTHMCKKKPWDAHMFTIFIFACLGSSSLL